MSETSKEITLQRNRLCVHSVRYDAADMEYAKLLRTVYVGNDLYTQLGKPANIVVTIQAGKE